MAQFRTISGETLEAAQFFPEADAMAAINQLMGPTEDKRFYDLDGDNPFVRLPVTSELFKKAMSCQWVVKIGTSFHACDNAIFKAAFQRVA